MDGKGRAKECRGLLSRGDEMEEEEGMHGSHKNDGGVSSREHQQRTGPTSSPLLRTRRASEDSHCRPWMMAAQMRIEADRCRRREGKGEERKGERETRQKNSDE